MTEETQESSPIPYNAEMEEAVLGSVIISPESIESVIWLRPDEFYIFRNTWIWEAMLDMYASKMTIDIVTLVDKLEACGHLADIGGAAYLAKIANVPASFLSIVDYAKIVRDYAMRRKIIKLASDAAKAAFDREKPIIESVPEIMNTLSGLIVSGEKRATSIKRAIDEFTLDFMERLENPVSVPGIKTGFLDIDTYLSGLNPGDLMYIAGEPASGKTKLCLQIAYNIANQGIGTAVYSQEMMEKAIIRRLVSGVAQVPTLMIKTGKFEGQEEKISAVYNAVGELHNLPLYLSDATWNTTELRADIARLKSQVGLQAFVLDYLLLLSGYEKIDNETERSARLSRDMKVICKDLGLVGIVVNSVTKEGMDTYDKPLKKNLRGSGQIIHDADIIGFLSELKERGMQNIAQLTFVKVRDVTYGTAIIELYKEREYPIFRDVQANKINLKASSDAGKTLWYQEQ